MRTRCDTHKNSQESEYCFHGCLHHTAWRVTSSPATSSTKSGPIHPGLRSTKRATKTNSVQQARTTPHQIHPNPMSCLLIPREIRIARTKGQANLLIGSLLLRRGQVARTLTNPRQRVGQACADGDKRGQRDHPLHSYSKGQSIAVPAVGLGAKERRSDRAAADIHSALLITK